MNENKYEMKIEAISKQIERKDELLKDMISGIDEWKDSKDMRNILLGQIRREQFSIKMLEIRLKFIKFINNFRNKTTSTRKA